MTLIRNPYTLWVMDRATIWGRRLRARREALDIGQTKLAKAVGTSQANLSRIERGEQLPVYELAKKLAEALSCDPAELFPWTLEDAEPDPEAVA